MLNGPPLLSLPSLPAWLTLDHVEQVLKIAAYITGALWAWFHFVRGRIFKPRLEPIVSGKLLALPDGLFAHTRVVLRNVGQSRVRIVDKGTGLRVFLPGPGLEGDWVYYRTASVFKPGDWLEPGETMQDETLVPVPANTVIARVELYITGKRSEWQVAALLVTDSKEAAVVNDGEIKKQRDLDLGRIRDLENQKAQAKRDRERIEAIEREKKAPKSPPPEEKK